MDEIAEGFHGKFNEDPEGVHGQLGRVDEENPGDIPQHGDGSRRTDEGAAQNMVHDDIKFLESVHR
jgi:hypothetical protein